MRVFCYILFCLVLTLVNASFHAARAQLGFDLKVDKPEPYEERQLKAEKTGENPLSCCASLWHTDFEQSES